MTDPKVDVEAWEMVPRRRVAGVFGGKKEGVGTRACAGSVGPMSGGGQACWQLLGLPARVQVKVRPWRRVSGTAERAGRQPRQTPVPCLIYTTWEGDEGCVRIWRIPNGRRKGQAQKSSVKSGEWLRGAKIPGRVSDWRNGKGGLRGRGTAGTPSGDATHKGTPY